LSNYIQHEAFRKTQGRALHLARTNIPQRFLPSIPHLKGRRLPAAPQRSGVKERRRAARLFPLLQNTF
jgi:hypothetical protein